MFDDETQRKIARLVEDMNDFRKCLVLGQYTRRYCVSPYFIEAFDELFVLVTSKRGE